MAIGPRRGNTGYHVGKIGFSLVIECPFCSRRQWALRLLILAFFAGNAFYSRDNPLYYLLPSFAPFNICFKILNGAVVNGHDVV